MSGELTIEVQAREVRGKNANRRLRGAGEIPAVVYGAGKDPAAIQINERTLADLLRKSGENAVFLLKLTGTKQSRHAMIKDLQRDPITGNMVHIDFQRILMDQKVRVSVPIQLEGTAEGVKNEGGMLDFVTREVEIECLPSKIPQVLVIDVSELHVGQHLEAKDLELEEEVELVDDPGKVLVSIAQGRIEEEDEEEEEEGLIEAPSAEPEVIGEENAED